MNSVRYPYAHRLVLNTYFSSSFYAPEDGCISINLSHKVHCACRHRVVALAHWRGPEKDCECSSRRPIADIAGLDDDRCRFIRWHVDRDFKVKLITPFLRIGDDRQCSCNFLCAWSIKKFCTQHDILNCYPDLNRHEHPSCANIFCLQY